MRTVEVSPSRRSPVRPRPAIRIRPVPRCDPPYDDELEAWAGPQGGPDASGGLRRDDGWPGVPERRLTQGNAAGPTVRSGAAAHLGPFAVAPDGPAAAPVAPDGPAAPPVVAGASAEARRAVRRFVSVLVEVLNGYRPPAHLRSLCRPIDAAEIIAHTRVAIHRIAEARRAPAGRPGATRRADHRADHRAVHRAADRHGRRPDAAAVLRLRLCEPHPGSVEATVLLVTGARTWALALRLDGGPDSWTASVARLL